MDPNPNPNPNGISGMSGMSGVSGMSGILLKNGQWYTRLYYYWFNQRVVDATIRMRFDGTDVPKNCIARALIIHHCHMIFQGDGKKINISSYHSS